MKPGTIADERGLDGSTIGSRTDRAIVGALRGQDLSGFEIWRWLGAEDAVSGLLAQPELYPALYRLEAERLLQSDWQEGDRTRRRYRLTAMAIERADDNNWPALPFHGDRSASTPDSAAGGSPAHAAITRDLDDGAWFVPPNAGPAAAANLERPDSGSTAGSPVTSLGSGEVVIAAYADGLEAALDLPRPERERVRQEIVDHLHDSSRALIASSADPQATANEAIDRLGPAHDLKIRIEAAQHSRGRLRRGRIGGVAIVASEMLVWALLSVAVIALVTLLADVVVGLAARSGNHLVVVRPGEWISSQFALVLCFGAFSAGRQSLGYFARASRHRPETLRKRWAVGGAIALSAIPLLVPFYADPLTLVEMLAIPLVFVAGAWGSERSIGAAFTARSVAVAGALFMAVAFMPGLRLLAFDPVAAPGTQAPAVWNTGDFSWTLVADGTYGYSLSNSAVSQGVALEVWPATKNGLSITVDPTASGPAVANALAHSVDMTKLPPHQQWWVVEVKTSPDGTRQAVDVEIQTGTSARFGSLLSWLVFRQ